jgi:hypothetical protein
MSIINALSPAFRSTLLAKNLIFFGRVHQLGDYMAVIAAMRSCPRMGRL